MESRAAVFTSSPQDVEVYATGEWLPGSLLGWRHDATGGCQVWVRVTVGDAEEQQWTGLECLRLPERHLTVAAEPAPVRHLQQMDAPLEDAHLEDAHLEDAHLEDAHLEDVAATRSLRLAEVSATGSPRRGRPAVAPSSRPDRTLTATREFPAIRDETASRASHPAGRRRADSRILGETAEFSVIGAAGRHRAPASPSGSGRHRAADTGTWPVLVDTTAVPAASEQRAAEPDLYTRPMRLGDLTASGAVPQPRAPRRNDSLSGV
jgi:hypothetical protein